MTNTSATHGLFAELLEGAKALEERPTIIADRDRAKAESEFHKGRLEIFTKAHDDLTAEIAALNAKIAAQEADLAHATFREGQVRSQLEMLVGAFKSVVGEAQAAVELVEPKVEEPVSISAPTPEPNTVTETTAETTAPASPLPFVEAPAAPSVEKVSNDTSDTTPVPTPEPTEAPDTVSITGEVSRNNGSGSASTSASPPNPYWTKPTTFTWREWLASGGERPSWISDAQLDTTY